jgi:hypothetical protein
MTYTIIQLSKLNIMPRPLYHLLLDRSEYKSYNISKLEPKLEAFARSEGEKDFRKTSIVSIDEANDYMKRECWIEDGKYNGRRATNIHWYNEGLYIIETK